MDSHTSLSRKFSLTCNTRFIKEHKLSNHICARIKSHVYTTEWTVYHSTYHVKRYSKANTNVIYYINDIMSGTAEAKYKYDKSSPKLSRWAEWGAGAERMEGDRPRAWAELARAAAALRPGCSERCCWARRSLGCGFGPGKRKGKARREGGLGWVFPWAGLFWVWASPRVWASFLFLNYTQTKLNSNSNLNSILALNQIKEMLRHDATTKI